MFVAFLMMKKKIMATASRGNFLLLLLSESVQRDSVLIVAGAPEEKGKCPNVIRIYPLKSCSPQPPTLVRRRGRKLRLLWLERLINEPSKKNLKSG